MDKIISIYSSEIVKNGQKRIPEKMNMINLMEKFGWTEEEYLNTTQNTIDLILAKNEIDYMNNQFKNDNK